MTNHYAQVVYRPALFAVYRISGILFFYTALLVGAYYGSFLLRFDDSLTAVHRSLFWRTLPIVLVGRLVCFYYAGLFRGWWRYVGMSDLLDITKAAFLSAIVNFLVLTRPFSYPGYLRSICGIDFILTLLL